MSKVIHQDIRLSRIDSVGLRWRVPSYAEGMGQVLHVERLWVEGKGDEVFVSALRRGEAINDDNILKQPVALKYLNNVLSWLDFMPGRRTGSQLVFELEVPGVMMAHVTCEPPMDWVAQNADEGYHRWLRENPGSTAEAWLGYLRARIHNGKINCKFHDCDQSVLPGTTTCREHQGS